MTKHVLLVDDDVAFCRVIGAALGDKGFTVYYAHTGKQAVEEAHKRHLDAVVIDLNLPDARGTDLLPKIKAAQNGKAIRAVIISGEFNAKFDSKNVLSKPVTLTSLINAIG